MSVLFDTKVSMLAVPCRSCRQALRWKSRPNQRTTGVDNAHEMRSAYGVCMKNMPMTATGRARMMAQTVRCRKRRYFSSCACSARSSNCLRSSPTSRS